MKPETQSNLESNSEIQTQKKQEEPKGVKIDGFQQVLEMLKIADTEFRESILKRLAKRDPNLASTLRANLRR